MLAVLGQLGQLGSSGSDPAPHDSVVLDSVSAASRRFQHKQSTITGETKEGVSAFPLALPHLIQIPPITVLVFRNTQLLGHPRGAPHVFAVPHLPSFIVIE